MANAVVFKPAGDTHVFKFHLQLAVQRTPITLLTFTARVAHRRTLRDETSRTDLDQRQWTFIPHLCKSVKMHLKMDGTHPCGWKAGGHSLSFIVDGFVYNCTKRRNLQTHLFHTNDAGKYTSYTKKSFKLHFSLDSSEDFVQKRHIQVQFKSV